MTGQALAHVDALRGFDGRSLEEAAASLGLCKPYVSRLAKEAGISLAGSRGPSKVAQMRDLAAAGFTRPEVAKELGVSVGYVNCSAHRHKIKFLRAGLVLEPAMREKQMAALYRSGRTLQEIGDEFGITRERVRQLLKKFFGIRAADGGQSRLAGEKRRRAAAARNSASLKHWGCSWEDYVRLRDMRKPTRAYAAQKQNAKKRGIAFELSLWQWWCIWHQSGKWESRGRGRGYMMCRNGDEGPYAVGNVFIASGCENSSNQKRKRSGLPTGVRKNARYRGYSAARSINGKLIRLGSFPTPELAHAAYLAAEPAQ